MTKILVIVALIGLLLFFIVGRLFRFAAGRSRSLEQWGFRQVSADPVTLHETIKSTVLTGLTGFALLLIILFLGVKIKILFLLFPISLYLILQLFLTANHIFSTRRIKVWYNPDSRDVRLQMKDGRVVDFNLYRDIESVDRVNAVQRNRKVMMGFYRFSGTRATFSLSCLLSENPENRFFFADVDGTFQPKISTRLFPWV